MSNQESYILIVEDEPHIAHLLEVNLQIDNYRTITADTGEEAWMHIVKALPQLILLDVMLPDTDGNTLCKKIKNQYPNIPILMLSALGQSSDRIRGLKSGADDYMPKPFNLEELLLKVQKLLKLYHSEIKENRNTVDKFGAISYNRNSHTLHCQNESLYLSVKEARLLEYLIDNKNQAIPRTDLITFLWGNKQNSNPRTIDNYISNIRKFIDKDSEQRIELKTVRGIGYMLMIPIK